MWKLFILCSFEISRSGRQKVFLKGFSWDFEKILRKQLSWSEFFKVYGTPSQLTLFFKVNKKNTRKTCAICLKLTIKTPGKVIYFFSFFIVSTVDVEQVNVSWDSCSVDQPWTQVLKNMLVNRKVFQMFILEVILN